MSNKDEIIKLEYPNPDDKGMRAIFRNNLRMGRPSKGIKKGGYKIIKFNTKNVWVKN